MTGAFASMALNSYGTVLMGYVALAFCVAFLFELLLLLPKQQEMSGTYKISLGIELIALAGLCFIHFLRGIDADITSTSQVKFVLFTILFGVNTYHLARAWKYAHTTPMKVKGNIALYFLSLLFFMASNYLPGIAAWVSIVLAFCCLITFAIAGWWTGKVILNGDETSAWIKVIQFRNKAGIQLVFFAVAALYFVLNAVHLLPPLYEGSLPNGYSKVVRQWESGKNNPNQKPTYPPDFVQAYKKFLDKKH